MSVRVLHNSIFPQSCGLGEIGIFRKSDDYNTNYPTTKTVQHKAGCGWVLASFTTERPEYKQAYKELCERWPIVFESPVRKNERTGHQFFFVIFDAGKGVGKY